MVDNEEVICASLNEYSFLQFRVSREVLLVPHNMTKILLYYNSFEDFDEKEGFFLNNKLYKDEVVMNNSLIRFKGNAFYVFVFHTTGMKINLRPGEVFCEGVILDHGTLTLTKKAFFFSFMNGNTEWAQCALSLVCIPQEMEKSKTSL